MRFLPAWASILISTIIALVGATFILSMTFETHNDHKYDLENAERLRRDAMDDMLDLHRSDMDRIESYMKEIRENQRIQDRDIKEILRSVNGGN